MGNVNLSKDKKTTLVGALVLLVGLSFYCLDYLVDLKKDVNHYMNGGMIISGVLLLVSPDRWVDLISEYVRSLFKSK
jgi:hypothetical protein